MIDLKRFLDALAGPEHPFVKGTRKEMDFQDAQEKETAAENEAGQRIVLKPFLSVDKN